MAACSQLHAHLLRGLPVFVVIVRQLMGAAAPRVTGSDFIVAGTTVGRIAQ